jgi:hypothetical protein
MGPNLAISMQLQIKQAMQLVGGLTNSIFPKAEAWLTSHTDHMEAVRFIAGRQDMNRYKSVMDFIFCEIFTTYRPACFRYYDDGGPMLKDIITTEEFAYFSDILPKALELAYRIWNEKRRTSWGTFRIEVFALAA